VRRAGELAHLLMPWAGLVTGVVALVIAHQFGADGVFDDCLSVSPVPLLVVSVLAIVATLAGALGSWQVLRNRSEGQARKVVAIVSVGSSALFVLAIVLPMIASVVIPPCFQ
jgi:hypothetical protein